MKTPLIQTLVLAWLLQLTGASADTFTSNTLIAAGDTRYDGLDIEVIGTSAQPTTLTVNGSHTFASLTVYGYGVVTHSPAPSGEAGNRLDLTITGDVLVHPGGSIDVSGKGYVGPAMPGGAPRSYDDGGGGGHGGDGGWAYFGPAVEPGGAGGQGSIIEPLDHGGSGGGTTQEASPDAPGGGAAKLMVGGTLTVNGALRANGTSAWINDQGGGAGGSIWVNAATLAGSGSITANGGTGEAATHGGGGGGGRIALYYGNHAFSGTLTAVGGPGQQRGGAGTIYRKVASSPAGDLTIDNGGTWGASTPLVSPVAFGLTLSNRAQAYPAAALTLRSLQVAADGVLYHRPSLPLDASVQENATIEVGGTLNGNGRGYPIAGDGGPGQGTHANTNDGTAGGGGHGGSGGYGYEGALAGGGEGYGSILQPTTLGSAGGFGDSGPELVPGGGAIRLSVGGTLTVNGQLSANGDNAFKNDQGGGAGGSLWLSVGGLTGSGSITANGGTGEAAAHGGGGAGGRIAIYSGSNNYTGALTAYGGAGAQRGGAGTLYTKANAASVGQLVLHNGDGVGAMTPLTAPENFHTLIERGGIAQPVAPLTLASLTLATNGQLYGTEAAEPMAIHVLGQMSVAAGAAFGGNGSLNVGGDLTVDLNGVLHADAKGHATNLSPGAGTGANMGNASNGGGHAGPGGLCFVGGANSSTYGSPLEPATFGSKGGDDNYGRGGNGGGKLRLQVGGTLTINGRLSANGEAAPSNNSGGGAGGSLWVNTHALAGGGLIAANGGNGEAGDGGGGGGGRIAIYYESRSFTGGITTYGGGGYQRGGAGTIYTRDAALSAGELIVSQGGNTGVPTPLASVTNFHLVIADQGLVQPDAPLVLSSLRIEAGGTLVQSPGQGALDLTTTGDLTIMTGGVLSATGCGYPVGDDQGPSPGTTAADNGGGGAHAGGGGIGYYGASGGPGGYGSIQEPQTYGSAGGTNTNSGPGGSGGGAIKIVAGGTVTVDGTLTADGAAAVSSNSGGGAGGSLWINAAGLAGDGAISANGGNGEDGDGGGGGGGHMAIHCQQDNFTGTLRAYGGGGCQYGGAGTIYRKSGAATYGSLLLDNQGRAGAMTPLRTSQASHLTLAGNVLVYPKVGEALIAASLDIDSNARLTHLNGQQLLVHVLQDAIVRTTGQITADGRGFPVGADPGPGHGLLDLDTGSGGGHGGAGGSNYAGVSGGAGYGSASAPVAWGSAGGPGDNNGIWCPGGGAIRLNIGGTLTVDGVISTNGGNAFCNDQGGGAGGSVWLNVRQLNGSGTVSARGGNGDSTDAGGGGGGRIAVYHDGSLGFDTNRLQVPGGTGTQTGGTGSVFLGDSSTNEVPSVLSMFPLDNVNRWVDSIDVAFNTAMAAASFTVADVLLATPSGSVSAGQLTVTPLTSQVFRIGFPLQTASGVYTLQLGPAITNPFGTPMTAAFTGSFTMDAPAHALTVTPGTGGLTVTWPTHSGILYQLESSPDLAHWLAEGSWAIGTGSPMQRTLPATGPCRFFRVAAEN